MNIIQQVNTTCIHNFVVHLCFKKSLLNMGIKLYINLPSKIKKLDNSTRFRKEVKLVMLNNLIFMLEKYLQAKSVQ